LSTGQKSKEELAIMIKSKRQQQQDKSLVDVDDDQNWRPDLPLKYSDLQDEHFPLFLTFDRVLRFSSFPPFYSFFLSWLHYLRLILV
jgi:hypothetical protein